MSALTRQSRGRRGQLSKRLSGHRSERPHLHDDQGMLMLNLALVLAVILSLITVTIMTGALGQLQLSSNATNRNGALEGALTGVQAVVADIRAAVQDGYVATTLLPCSTVIPSGLTNASGGSSFIASVQYEDVDAQGKDTPVSSCTPGQGPAPAAPGSYLAQAIITSCSPASACPASATSAPTGNETWRRVVSTYDFNTSYANTPGGLIYSYSREECLEATYNNGTSPSGGVTLQVTTSCSTSNNREQFQYTSTWNLEIQLGSGEYCVQNPEDESPASTSPVPLTTNCTPTAVAQWGVNDNGGIQGVAATGSPPGQPYTTGSGAQGACLANPNPNNTGNTTANATVESTDCDSAMDNTSTWQMSAEVGAGDSQPPSGQPFNTATDQLVNFEEFGYCLDVTDQNVGSVFLIDYMCKQFPDTNDYPAWNQRWCFKQLTTNSGNPEGLLYTPEGQTTCPTNPTSPYCLASPLYPASGLLGATAYVTVTSCKANLSEPLASQPADLLWTEWGANGGPEHEYTWTDNGGLCLEANLGNKQPPPGNSDTFSTIQVDTCSPDGSAMQKWNAPAVYGESQITNTHEQTGPGTYTGP
jgi:hypothetical protein